MVERLICVLFCLSLGLAANTVRAKVSIREIDGPTGKELRLENEYLAIQISPNVGGVVREFTYKPTGRQESVVGQQLGGLCEDRLGGQPYPDDIARLPYLYRITVHAADRVAVELSLAPPAGRTQGLVFKKTYTLASGQSALQVDWEINNASRETRDVVPWVHHIVERYGDKFGDMATLTSDGLQTGRLTEVFLHPASNWFARLSGTYAPQHSLLYFVGNHQHLYQFYNTYFNLWHCMEMIYNIAVLDPGQSWQTRYFVVGAPALARVDFATVELAAAVRRVEPFVDVLLSPAVDLGTVTVRAQWVSDAGDRALPDQQVGLASAGQAPAKLRYEAADLRGAGVLKLTLIRDGKPVALGEAVGAFNHEITLHVPDAEGRMPAVTPWPRPRVRSWNTIEPRQVSFPVVHRDDRGSIWSAPMLERIFLEDQNTNSQPAAALVQVAGARRERESFQLVLSPKVDWKQAKVEVTPLRGSQDSRVVPTLGWRRVGYVETSIPMKYQRDIPVGKWPDPLLWPEIFDAPAGINTPLLFTLEIPGDAAAGQYTGRIQISANDGQWSADIEVRATVWDFSLPATGTFTSVVGAGPLFGDPRARLREVGCTIPMAQVEQRLIRSAADHRINAVMPSFHDVERSIADLKLAREKGLRGIRVPAQLLKDPSRLRKLSELLEKNGWLNEAYVYSPFDEAPPDRFEEVRQWCRRWKEVTPIRIMQVYYFPKPEPIYGSPDIWCRAVADEPWIRERQQAGDEFWVANSNLIFLERDLLVGRSELWRAFRRGFNGQLLWTIAQWSVNPWDNPWYSASNGNALLYYPHASGFVETLRLEAYTDAVEDYEYLTLLRNAAEGLASQDPQSPLIVEARSIYNAVDLGQKHERSNDLLEARQRIAELIMRINAQNAGRR